MELNMENIDIYTVINVPTGFSPEVLLRETFRFPAVFMGNICSFSC